MFYNQDTFSIYPKNIACGVYFADFVGKINTTKQFWGRFLVFGMLPVVEVTGHELIHKR